ncbi:MAG: hypothetical protein K2X99_07925 [Gemmatimonadaceae bacterium]|nr:hypothetical protein [Gemmatimonadaceae bacterium]
MSRRRRLGVIGSFVWDEIHGRDPARAPVEEWGGITYALAAADAALDDGWEIVPLVKVGADLAPQARDYLRSLSRIAPDATPIIVPQANNRVVLRYTSAERRTEQLRGGVPGWSWLGLKPLLADLDALYVNLISGFELDLETAWMMRQHFAGPIYGDLHSLLLAVQPDGLRTPRTLPDAPAWLRCFDLLQVNEDEMRLLAPDPLALAATAMHQGVRCLTVTLGARGIVYVAAPGFDEAPLARATDPWRTAELAPLRTALLMPAAHDVKTGDPTGCGDVWGATYYSRLLVGDKFLNAIDAASAAAARNVEHRGATGLATFLRGGLHPA